MKGSGCGSVGRGVASKSKGMQFESSHQQKIILNIYCQLYRKDENREKEAGNGPFLKRKKEMKMAEQKDESIDGNYGNKSNTQNTYKASKGKYPFSFKSR